MKNNVKWILFALAFAAVLGGAYVLYGRLSAEYGEKESTPATKEELTVEGNVESETQEAFPAPDFTALDEQGNKVRLSDYKGKPIVLNFWATWCHYCKEEMPDFQTAFEKYPDVQFVMVNATDGVRETKEKAEDYLKDEGFTFPVLFDTEEEAVYNYYVTGFPSTYFIDENMNLVTYGSGQLSLENLEKGIALIR